MSAIDSISTSAPPSSGRAFDQFSSDEFLRIIFTELSNQDPLAPSDTKEILNQLGLIRQIESNISLTENLESIVRQNEIASASSLIGKVVQGLSTIGERVLGEVLSVSVTREGPILNLPDDIRVPMRQVDEIIDRSIFTEAPPVTGA